MGESSLEKLENISELLVLRLFGLAVHLNCFFFSSVWLPFVSFVIGLPIFNSPPHFISLFCLSGKRQQKAEKNKSE